MHAVNRVEAAFFSLTPPAPPDDDGSYLRWHLLDHMPEQYRLPGIVLGTRWIADGDYASARLAGAGPLAETGNVVNYLVGEPVQQTHDDFMALGRRLGELGRFPQRRPSLEVSFVGRLHAYAAPSALVSAEVVPFRPHRGVIVIVEEPAGDNAPWLQWLHREHYRALLDAPGVAGVWMYGSTGLWRLHPNVQHDSRYVTVVYLDEDPIATTKALTPMIEERWATRAVRPLFAGPLRSMVHWDAWPD